MNEHAPPKYSVDRMIGMYVKIRDEIRAIEERHKEELERPKAALAKLSDMLLAHFAETGADNVSAKGVGTAYRTSRRSATIADGSEFRRFVIGGEHYDLIDWRANAKAVGEFIEEHETPPPGVNYSVTYTVGVRRS